MEIYYFTRTNRSKNIAEQLGEKYNVNAYSITDNENWNGPLNFIKGGYMASSKKNSNILYKKPKGEEPIILVFPIWAGTYPPAIRSFLTENKNEKIVAIPTSLGSKLKDRNDFIEVFDLVGKEISINSLDLEKFTSK